VLRTTFYGRFYHDSVSAKSNGDEESLVRGGARRMRAREEEVCLESIGLLQYLRASRQENNSSLG